MESKRGELERDPRRASSLRRLWIWHVMYSRSIRTRRGRLIVLPVVQTLRLPQWSALAYTLSRQHSNSAQLIADIYGGLNCFDGR